MRGSHDPARLTLRAKWSLLEMRFSQDEEPLRAHFVSRSRKNRFRAALKLRSHHTLTLHFDSQKGSRPMLRRMFEKLFAFHRNYTSLKRKRGTSLRRETARRNFLRVESRRILNSSVATHKDPPNLASETIDVTTMT